MPDWIKRAGRAIAAMIGIAALFTWFGVYNTGSLPLLPRFALWLMTMVIGYMSAYLIIPQIERRFGDHWPLPGQIALVAGFISVPITLSLMVISQDPWSFEKFFIQYGYVLVISLLLGTLHFIIRPDASAEPNTDPVQVFLERLPVKYRTSALYAVSAEDHYLRVYTSVGEELILMRLADALKELTGAQGLQTHRSWWVAHDGVAEVRRVEGKTVLVLKSGAEASVSRRYAGDVKAAGLS